MTSYITHKDDDIFLDLIIEHVDSIIKSEDKLSYHFLSRYYTSMFKLYIDDIIHLYDTDFKFKYIFISNIKSLILYRIDERRNNYEFNKENN